MKIIRTQKTPVRFDVVPLGTVFETYAAIDPTPCIKIEPCVNRFGEMSNAVPLDVGELWCFKDTDEVIILDAELTIK